MTDRESQVAQIIWSARRAKGMTQQKLADAIGVTQQTVALWEKGSAPRSALVSKIEQTLGVQLWASISLTASELAPMPSPTLTEYWRSRYLSALEDNVRLRKEIDSLTLMAGKLLETQETQEGNG